MNSLNSLTTLHSLPERRTGRLLAPDRASAALAHRQFAYFLEYLRPSDLMMLNNARVIPTRLFGRKTPGGKLEILMEGVLDSHRVLACVRL